VQPDIEFAEQALQHGFTLAAAGFEVDLQAFVVRSIEAILHAFGADRLGSNQFVVLRAVLAEALGNNGFGEEGPFSFLILNLAVVRSAISSRLVNWRLSKATASSQAGATSAWGRVTFSVVMMPSC
jgi:hypothetical protein